MPFAIVQTVAPSAEPVSLARAKSHLRVTWSTDDDYIADLLTGAIEAAQRECGQQFVTATFKLILDDFPRSGADECSGAGRRASALRIPLSPIVAVDSILYADSAGNSQTLDASTYAVGRFTGRVSPVTFWPITNPRGLENVSITFRAGYGAASDVPKDAFAAVLLILADRYENRGDAGGKDERAIPAAALRLLNNLRGGEQW
jgi:uncharacterized phiE125 gp8 family phage protein